MPDKQETLDGSRREFGNLKDVATEWTTTNTDDMSVLELIVTKVYKPFVKTIQVENDQGENKIVEKAYIYASDGSRTLPVRLNKFSQDNLGATLGNEIAKWDKKKVYAVHQKIGNTEFLSLKPKVK